MNEYDRRNMRGPSIDTGMRCAICGRVGAPLNRHHIVPRSRGGGRGPLITLCGLGNNLRDGSGRPFCHGLAHAYRLHLRWTGRVWEYLLTDEPTKVDRAMSMDGWRPIEWGGGTEEIEYSDDVPWLHTVATPPVSYDWGERDGGVELPF